MFDGTSHVVIKIIMIRIGHEKWGQEMDVHLEPSATRTVLHVHVNISALDYKVIVLQVLLWYQNKFLFGHFVM